MNRPTDSYLSDYINSFYFLTETSTTIGYGDNTVTINSSIPVNTPPNESQYLFGTLLILFGLIFFGYISRLVVMTYLLWFQNEKASLDQKEDLSDWIAARNRKIAGGMPYNYERKINEHITFIYLQDVASCVNETAYLDQISNGIKFSVLKSATFKLISSFEFLHFLPLPIAIDIVTQSVPQNFISGEIIIKKGEKSKGVYFILSGQVGVMQIENECPVRRLAVCEFPDNFGEFGLIELTSSFEYQALKPTICLFVEIEKILDLLKFIPPATMGFILKVIRHNHITNQSGVLKENSKILLNQDSCKVKKIIKKSKDLPQNNGNLKENFNKEAFFPLSRSHTGVTKIPKGDTRKLDYRTPEENPDGNILTTEEDKDEPGSPGQNIPDLFSGNENVPTQPNAQPENQSNPLQAPSASTKPQASGPHFPIGVHPKERSPIAEREGIEPEAEIQDLMIAVIEGDGLGQEKITNLTAIEEIVLKTDLNEVQDVLEDSKLIERTSALLPFESVVDYELPISSQLESIEVRLEV